MGTRGEGVAKSRLPGHLATITLPEACRRLRHVERRFDCLVQLRDLVGVACTHQPLQSVARDREHVVEVRDTPDWKPLPAAEDYFGRELANRSGDERDDNRANAVENGIPVRITIGRLPTGGGSSAHHTSPRFTRRWLSNWGYWAAHLAMRPVPRRRRFRQDR